MQCAVIEFARSVLHWHGANSTEFNSNLPDERQVIVDMPEHRPSLDKQGMGGTMRLGRRTTVFLKKDSKLSDKRKKKIRVIINKYRIHSEIEVSRLI